MLQSFIIILREGFESFLLVAVILSFLRKSGRRQLAPAVYWAIGVALALSVALGYLLFEMQTGRDELIQHYLGQTVAGFLGNESLREAVLGVVAIVMVFSLIVYMWLTGPKLKQRMEDRLGAVSVRPSGWAAFAGVFLFTVLTVSREGMETALMLLQVRSPRLIWGALLGLAAAVAMAWTWAQFGHLIGNRLGIGGIAGVDLDGHGTALGIGHQTEDDLQLALLVVARVTQFAERAVTSLEIGGGQVVEHQRSLRQVAFG